MSRDQLVDVTARRWGGVLTHKFPRAEWISVGGCPRTSSHVEAYDSVMRVN